MSKKALPIVIFGTEGAAKDIFYWIKAINEQSCEKKFVVEGFIEQDERFIGNDAFGVGKVIGCDNGLEKLIENYEEIGLVIPFGNPYVREKIVNEVSKYPNVTFPNIVHPSVIFDRDGGEMGIGNHIGPGTIIESIYNFGNFNYISGGVHLGHDITVGNFNSINPSATTAGYVTFGNRCMLGINATVIQNLKISDDITVGAGAVVTKNLTEKGVYVGIPARHIKKD